MGKMKKFEYKSLKTTEKKSFLQSSLDTQELELYLNKLGDEGWELVSAVGTNAADGRTNEIVLLFKREKLE